MNLDLELSSKEIFDNFRHALDLRVGQFGINRQAQALARGFFGHGKIAGLVAEARVTFLQMQWQWIVQRAADAVGIEIFF